MNPEAPRPVIVVDIQMPFISMIMLMVKWALSAIPALMILFAIFTVLTSFLGGVTTTVFRW